MAGERAVVVAGSTTTTAATTTTTNNEGEQQQQQNDQAQQQQHQEQHSRVGGILECDDGEEDLPTLSSPPLLITNQTQQPPVVSNNNNKQQQQQPVTEHQEQQQQQQQRVCSVVASAVGMSFVEVCQIRLQQLFPQVLPPQRSTLCEDSIELTSECLANDVIRYLLKEDIYLISRDPISRSMRHNVYQMLNKHSILFTSMVNRLNVVPDTAYEAFMGVADELFYQGITWARIVCLYAFMGRLALWARDRRMHSLKQKLPMYVSRYIGEEIAQFIKICGGWEQLCIEYPVAEEVTGAIWRSLLMTGATLGLVATILSVTS